MCVPSFRRDLKPPYPLLFELQGWYEPEVSDIVRIRALQTHGFGAFPIAVVFDKVGDEDWKKKSLN